MNITQANPMAAMMQGREMAHQAKQLQRKNALAALYQERGAEIASGDQDALNALAALAPMEARQILRQGEQDSIAADQREYIRGRDQAADQWRREDRNYTRGRQSAADARAASVHRMQMERHAAALSAQERAAAAAEVEKAVTIMSTAQTPEQWDALATQYGQEEYVGRFNERQAIQAQFLELGDVLRAQEQPEPADEYGRYVQEEQSAGREPLSRIDYAQAKKGNGVSMRMADGTEVQVGGNGNTKFTEQQSKDNVYSTRARGALEAFEPVADSLTSPANRAANLDPTGLARGLQNDDFQVAEQAGTEFLQAILRKDTGAAITEGEVNSYGKVYLPQVGDGPDVLQAKKEARIRAINALESGMTSSQILARDRALVKAAEETKQATQPQSNPKTGEIPSITTDDEFDALPSGTVFMAPDGTQRRKP